MFLAIAGAIGLGYVMSGHVASMTTRFPRGMAPFTCMVVLGVVCAVRSFVREIRSQLPIGSSTTSMNSPLGLFGRHVTGRQAVLVFVLFLACGVTLCFLYGDQIGGAETHEKSGSIFTGELLGASLCMMACLHVVRRVALRSQRLAE
jgi:hypothetical protein